MHRTESFDHPLILTFSHSEGGEATLFATFADTGHDPGDRGPLRIALSKGDAGHPFIVT
jgi:hypothetical protein